MKKPISMLLCLVLTGSAIALVACSENAAATAKCTTAHDSEGCTKCCNDNGASGNTFRGSTCTCRGGS